MVKTLVSIDRNPSCQYGTFGVLSINDIPQCLTLEPVISDIPDGEYKCIAHSGPKWQNVWEITNVPNHKAILIHAGNTVDDSEGCVLVGQSFVNINSKRGISNSVITLNNLRQILPDFFMLTIRSIK